MADASDPADGGPVISPVSPVPPVSPPGEDVTPPPTPDAAGAAAAAGEDALGPDPGPEGKAESAEAAEAASERRKEQDEREEDDRGYDDLRRVHQLVNNNFYGGVDASGAAFGFGAASSPGLAPGTIEPEETDRALRFYVPPQLCFDEAHGKLHDHALVVLTGQDNCGRGAGSLALLRKILGEGARLRSLSPANALAELAASRDLKPGQGYVILDYVGELQAEAVQAYEIGRLSEELRRKGSYLVITADDTARRRLALRDHCVPWRAPDPVELFDHCREKLPYGDLEPDTEKELLERVGEQRRPADVVAAAVALSQKGPQTALETLRDRHRELVQAWFRKRPGADDLLALAALAFLEGIPERTFEKECAALAAHVRNWEQSGETPVAEPDGPAGAPLSGAVTGQSRARWRERAVGLVTTEFRLGPSRDAGRSERCLVFTSPRIRELVIAELHDLYGYELWYPLRRWLGELALLGDLDTRAEVARGVALLARYALVEVDENLLQVWSEGITSQRVTAALTLQFMCDVEHLAPQARNIVLSWVDNRGAGRAVTAAMALTGRLGSLYRLEALNWLWFLANRGERVAFSARRSLVLLLQTAEQDPERALLILRYVRTVIAKAGPGSRERSIALRTAVQLLEANRLEAPCEPFTAALLRTVPDSARHLGALWANVLHSSSRSRAVSALCRTLVQLRDDPSVTGAVQELGEAMRNAMSPRQWTALRHHLSIALKHPDYAIPGAGRLAQVLLGSLRGRTPTDARRSTASLTSPRPPGSHRSSRSTPPFPSAQGGRSK
ncbi:hypothetical protein ACM01_35970 [Streptomyces viridochromogenes]|uniref:Uncharacterized protein n=1 Tax=Streptomyces viridochromogenes TaxID=1938 RepID=A0A0J7YZT6_STRVR|nr:hypothetical protein [Streptomyces viridochromogenes]KMS69221.1 hypothetical protein ACM01_35970 [Streptomyces viridochromogenes]